VYIPSHFEETRPEILQSLIAAHPLGTLVVAGADGLDAHHLPFELNPAEGEHGQLLAHVARANPVWQNVHDTAVVLVIFRGAEGYISPNWYPSKQLTHRQVPTWNYQAVHVDGRITIRDDERFVRGVVARLTRTHEARTSSTPWRMGDAPAEYTDDLLKAIVGIEIRITRMRGKFKLSQNRDMPDRLAAIAALDARGEVALAQEMKNTLQK
jgi:transcriptional regulator